MFDLIQKQELYHLVPEMVSNLMNLDSTQTLDILKTDKFKKFDPKLVIEKLKHDEINLYKVCVTFKLITVRLRTHW